VTARAIIFPVDELVSLLEGKKTQFRRLIRDDMNGYMLASSVLWRPRAYIAPPEVRDGGYPTRAVDGCPYGRVGDTLWVKEAWTTDTGHDYFAGMRYRISTPGAETTRRHQNCPVPRDGKTTSWQCYSPDGYGCFGGMRWHSPASMPRVGARLKFTIDGVRIEPLQRISHEDAIAEGVRVCDGMPASDRWVGAAAIPPAKMGFTENTKIADRNWRRIVHDTPRAAFKAWWNHRHPGQRWHQNPMVWVVTVRAHGTQ